MGCWRGTDDLMGEDSRVHVVERVNMVKSRLLGR